MSGFHSFFNANNSDTAQMSTKRHYNDQDVAFPPLFEVASFINNSPEMNILDLDANGELLISCQTSCNVTKKPSHSLLDLFHASAFGFSFHDTDFKVLIVNENRSVQEGSDLYPPAVNVTNINSYAVNQSTFTYKGQTYRKFTFFGRTKNPRIGGYVFNWLFKCPHRIDVSPILAKETRIVCYIAFAFSSCVNFENIKQFLYDTEVIESGTPLHMYDKRLPLSSKGKTDQVTKCAAIEVDINDHDTVHKSIFKHRTNPIFYGLYRCLKPIPVTLKATMKSHRDIFRDHQQFIDNHSVIIGTIPEGVDYKEYEGLCRYLVDIKDSEGNYMFLTIDTYNNKIYFAGFTSFISAMHDYIQGYTSENNLALELEEPSGEDLEVQYMNTVAPGTNTPKKQKQSRPAIIEFDNSSYASKTTVLSPASTTPAQIQKLINDSIKKNEEHRPSPPTEHPSDNHINNLIDIKVKPVKQLIISTTTTLTANMRELKDTQSEMKQAQLRLSSLVTQANTKATNAESKVSKLKSDHDTLKSSFDSHSNSVINRIGRYEFKLDDHIEHTEAQLEKLQEEDKKILTQQTSFNDGLDDMLRTLCEQIPDADWGPPATVTNNTAITDTDMFSLASGSLLTQSQAFEECKNKDD